MRGRRGDRPPPRSRSSERMKGRVFEGRAAESLRSETLRYPAFEERSALNKLNRGLGQTPFCGVCDLPKGLAFPFQPISGESILSGSMPFYKRIYSPGEPQFITSSTCCRAPFFRSGRFCTVTR
jgi:hypothetical protein